MKLEEIKVLLVFPRADPYCMCLEEVRNLGAIAKVDEGGSQQI